MKTPKPRRILDAVQAFAFEAHENLRVALLAVLVLHWLLFFAGHAHLAIGHFFPWISQARLAAPIQELKGIGRLGLAYPEAQNALASAVQGLGLVIRKSTCVERYGALSRHRCERLMSRWRTQ